MLRTVRATRYVTPLREGGSLPAIVEADDDGLYVAKFRGAGQGPLALLAELVAGEIGRALGLRIPEIVFIELDSDLARNEADPEIRDLLLASAGLNLALDYLPGSVMFDPAAGDRADAGIASSAVWFDAFVTNVDRTARNANLLCWHDHLYFIDHGAALYFQHDWGDLDRKAATPFAAVRDHILLRWASNLAEVSPALAARLPVELFHAILAQVPDAWLTPEPDALTPEAKRAGYTRYLTARLAAVPVFVEEALRARSRLL